MLKNQLHRDKIIWSQSIIYCTIKSRCLNVYYVALGLGLVYNIIPTRVIAIIQSYLHEYLKYTLLQTSVCTVYTNP